MPTNNTTNTTLLMTLLSNDPSHVTTPTTLLLLQQRSGYWVLVFAHLLEFVPKKNPISSSFSNKMIIKEQRVSSRHFKNLQKPAFFMKEPVLIQVVVLPPVI